MVVIMVVSRHCRLGDGTVVVEVGVIVVVVVAVLCVVVDILKSTVLLSFVGKSNA